MLQLGKNINVIWGLPCSCGAREITNIYMLVLFDAEIYFFFNKNLPLSGTGKHVRALRMAMVKESTPSVTRQLSLLLSKVAQTRSQRYPFPVYLLH